MTTIIKEVNGYEIRFDGEKRNTNTHPFSIKWGPSFNQVYVFKTLKSAERWAEKH